MKVPCCRWRQKRGGPNHSGLPRNGNNPAASIAPRGTGTQGGKTAKPAKSPSANVRPIQGGGVKVRTFYIVSPISTGIRSRFVITR